MLTNIKGNGPEFSVILESEGLFRHFDNRRQVAAYAGLAPAPWQSGNIDREQGVSKAGNPRLRTTMAQLAWLWLRHQPDFALARWFNKRVAYKGGRLKRATIVALGPSFHPHPHGHFSVKLNASDIIGAMEPHF